MIAVASLAFRPIDAGSRPAFVNPTDGHGDTAQSRSSTAPASSMGPDGDDIPGEAMPGTSASLDDRPTPSQSRPAPPDGLSGYRWPVEHARITNGFGAGHPGSFVVDGRTFHDGIDVSSFCGAPILAAHDGLVLAAGRHHEAYLGWLGDLGAFRARLDAGHGWAGQSITVVLDDLDGYRSIYAHLARTAVKAGDAVVAGEVIAYQGASGNATGCHLHFAIFSPLEPRTLALEAKIAAKTRLPDREIWRLDPLLVLPPPGDAAITWGWGARDEP